MSESQVNSSKLFPVHHEQLKLSFPIKRKRLGHVRKVSNDFDEQKYQTERPWKNIGEILHSLQKDKDVCRVIQTKISHQRRLVRSFVQSFK